MGDFDRVDNSAKGKETKKLVIVLALGVVLVGLVFFEMSKKGPPEAMAGIPGVPQTMAPVVIEETPEQVLIALKKDPTVTLLQDWSGDTQAFKKVPRNPFRMSDGWRVILVKPEVVPVVSTPRVDTTPQFVKPQAVPVKIEDYKLAMTTRLGTVWTAVINGQMVETGMVVDKARVVDIKDGSVTLQHVDFPDGPKTELKRK